jgi:hypothetical protein
MMARCLIKGDIYNDHLNIFINASDNELEDFLVLIEEHYGLNGFSISNPEFSALCSFHPNIARVVVPNIPIYLGIESHHFIMMFGWSELRIGNSSDSMSITVDTVVSLANEEDGLIIKVFYFIDNHVK